MPTRVFKVVIETKPDGWDEVSIFRHDKALLEFSAPARARLDQTAVKIGKLIMSEVDGEQ